jgi:DNA-binding LacI/PurR family transcriptional regulator
MADVFFSYKREDRPTVERLVRLFKKEGFTVWWDAVLEDGELFSDVIREELNKTWCVVVCWSALSVNSRWVLHEARVGRAQNMLVPISLDGTKPPLGFQHIQTGQLAGWNGNRKDIGVRRLIAGARKLVVHPEAQSDVAAKAVHSDAEDRANIRQKRHEVARNRKVFLICASTAEEWQLALNNDLLLSLRRANLSCTVLVPSGDHLVGEHEALQQEVLADKKEYAGGIIIISGWPEEQAGQLTWFAEQFQKPVVFVDHNPFDSNLKPWNTTYVSVNDAEGGKLAGEAVLRLAKEKPVRRILVISGFAKQKRYEAFKEAVSELNCDVLISEDGKFDRWIAENVVHNRLNEALKRRQPFDVVYCTADSMTLGCLDAIDRIRNWRGGKKPRVVGYDGTVTTQHLVESADSLLARVVVQDTKELARVSTDQLARMRQGEDVSQVVWIKPYLFPREKETATSNEASRTLGA